MKKKIKNWINNFNVYALDARLGGHYKKEQFYYVVNDILRDIFFWLYKE